MKKKLIAIVVIVLIVLGVRAVLQPDIGFHRDETVTIVPGESFVVGSGFREEYDKSSDTMIKEKLTAEQYRITQKDGTERPFDNEYFDNKAKGIYVDLLSGEPLFASIHKYKSGTGWPSFTRPISYEMVTEHEDKSLLVTRTEIRSKHGDNHIGHVFNDGPAPTYTRYCMNSAALKFIAYEDMEQEGYGNLLSLFE